MTARKIIDAVENLVMRLCAFAMPLQQLPGFTTSTAVLLGLCSIFFFHNAKQAIPQ
jgi:hypothetical protein